MRRTCVTAVVLIVLTGCGLSDYEKRMDEQRERLKLFDEESALLYDMIDMPMGKDAYGNEIKVPFEVFLRLPIGFSGKFDGPKVIYSADKQSLYRYSSGKADVNVLVAWARVADKNAKVAAKEDEVLPEDFRAKVRGGLMDFITRTYSVGANPDFSQLKEDPRQVVRDGLPRTLDFKSTTFDDSRQHRYFVYFQQWSDRQAAVIYQVPAQPADQKYPRMMDVSLKTLEITGSAAAKRAEFRSRPRG